MNVSNLKFHDLRRIDTWQLAWYVLGAYASSFALSIALTQIFLISFLVFILVSLKRDAGKSSFFIYCRDILTPYPLLWTFYSPLVLWLMICFFSAFLGLSIQHSLLGLFKFSTYLLLPLFVFFILMREEEGVRVSKVKRLLILFVLSHGIAGLHTFVSTNLGYEIRPRVPGPLTESGQLELLFPVLLVLPSLFGQIARVRVYVFTSITLMSLWIALTWMFSAKIALIAGVLVCLFLFAKHSFFKISGREILILLCVSLSLSALLFGLKRGPWFAIGVELLVVGVSYYGLRSFGVILLGLPFFFFPEVRDRIFSLSDHFFISGGRFDMWKLGLELIERFPMGLGFGNSDLIRIFDSTLPYMHRHMHNNFLNIMLECGLLGGIVFFIWIFRVVLISWPLGRYLRSSEPDFWKYLRGALVVSVIGWQLGGLVEYNLGDGEIRLFALVLLGFYLTSLYSGHNCVPRVK